MKKSNRSKPLHRLSRLPPYFTNKGGRAFILAANLLLSDPKSLAIHLATNKRVISLLSDLALQNLPAESDQSHYGETANIARQANAIYIQADIIGEQVFSLGADKHFV